MYQFYRREFMSFSGVRIIANFRLGTIDCNTMQAIIVDDEYGMSGITLEPGDVVVDIGAYIGGFSLLAASFGSGIKVLSYEPIPENIDLIQKNANENGFSNIRAFPVAIEGCGEQTRIYYGAESTDSGVQHHFVGNARGESGSSWIDVPVMTLPLVFEENNIMKCRVLKIDAEGAELEIFQNTPTEVFSLIDYIVGEHHQHPRSMILEATKGVFVDVPCRGSTEDNLGVFFFKRASLL